MKRVEVTRLLFFVLIGIGMAGILPCSDLFARTFDTDSWVDAEQVVATKKPVAKEQVVATEKPKAYHQIHRPGFQITQDSMSVKPVSYPDPNRVFFRSLTVPGWGQVINQQTWKVPLIAGALVGVAAYTVYLDQEYRDYRAAFYNASRPDSDEAFGPTPPDLLNVNINQLRTNRNTLRNRRDFMIVMFGAAYLLQGVDAYVYAHMRSFDVSDDLTIAPSIRPDVLDHQTPGITLRLDFYSRK